MGSKIAGDLSGIPCSLFVTPCCHTLPPSPLKAHYCKSICPQYVGSAQGIDAKAKLLEWYPGGGNHRNDVKQRQKVCISNKAEIKVSTSTVAALFSEMALTGQRIARVDMVFLVFSSMSISTVGVDGARVCL